MRRSGNYLAFGAALVMPLIFCGAPARSQQAAPPAKPAGTPQSTGQAKPATTTPAPKPALSAALRDQWKFVSQEFIAAADAMPEEKYGFAPTNGEFTGVRSFAEQVKHVACANFAFFDELEKKTPPVDCEHGGPSDARTKAELMNYVGQSFAYGDTVIAKITPLNMLDKIEGRYATPNTRIGMVMTAVWHSTDHYGQMVEYLRMNGIVPPASR
jgi:hypothetical protein